MKNIHTIFWMGILLAAMPVVASEAEDASGYTDAYNDDLERAIEAAARRRGVEPITFQHPREAFHLPPEQAPITVDSSSEDGFDAEDGSDTEEDPVYGMAVQRRETVGEAAGGGGGGRDAARSWTKKPKGTDHSVGLFRKERPSKKSTPPAYVTTWNDFKGLKPEHAVRKIINALNRGVYQASHKTTYIETIEENIADMRQVMRSSDLYPQLNDEQKELIESRIQKATDDIRALRQRTEANAKEDRALEGDISKRSKTDSGAAGGGGGGGSGIVIRRSEISKPKSTQDAGMPPLPQRGVDQTSMPTMNIGQDFAQANEVLRIRHTLVKGMSDLRLRAITPGQFMNIIAGVMPQVLMLQSSSTLTPQQRQEIDALIQQAHVYVRYFQGA